MGFFRKKQKPKPDHDQKQETTPMAETNETAETAETAGTTAETEVEYDYDEVVRVLSAVDSEHGIFETRVEALREVLHEGDPKKVKTALGKVKRASQDYRLSLKELNSLTL